MGLKIKSVQLDPKGKWVKLDFEQSAVEVGGEIVNSKEKKQVYKKPHADLTNSFKKMVPHFLFLCQIFKVNKFELPYFDNLSFLEEDRFDGINVTGIIISGKDRDFIELVGSKTTDKLEVVEWTSPKLWLEDKSEKRYVLTDIFRTNYSNLMNEVEKFYSGKFAPKEEQVEFQF